MSRPLRIEYPGAFYHVTSRGNEQKEIFKSQRDREKFLSYLQSAVKRYEAVLHAYCLMSNHYHLLLETPAGNLSQIMRHINGSYTTYFNIKRKRAGHLFQGRYKAILVEAEEHAVELSRYIHLNPVRAGIVARPEKYPWSSCRFYIGQDTLSEWLKTDFILGHFGDKETEAGKKYRQFVEELMDKDYESPLRAVVASTILGSHEFISGVRETHLAAREADRSLPALKKLSRRPSVEAMARAIESAVGKGNPLLRPISIYYCHKYSCAKLKEIGEYFGISDAAVSQTSRRLMLRAAKDTGIKQIVNKAGKVLDAYKG